MDQKKVEKKSLIIRLLFLFIGFLLFLLLFGMGESIDYTKITTIFKLLGLGIYLLIGEKLIWYVSDLKS